MKTVLIIGSVYGGILASAVFSEILAKKNLSIALVERPCPPQRSDFLQFEDNKPVFKVEAFKAPPVKNAQDFYDAPRVKPYQETPTWRDKKRK